MESKLPVFVTRDIRFGLTLFWMEIVNYHDWELTIIYCMTVLCIGKDLKDACQI